MDAAAWIRSRLAGFTCAACGRHYRRDRIRVLAQREALFFVALDCGACASESVAIVSLDQAADGGRARLDVGDLADPPVDVSDPDSTVLATDVLAMHEFLGGFDGDFRGLFGSSRERPGAAGA
ncbi:MAG TPA: hypothetical protein VMH24_03685 [Candidatus Sulfotelmatobacter sp.]|nr:hypothetical protein [Candidatus Sulfotelmatobacter sp.]